MQTPHMHRPVVRWSLFFFNFSMSQNYLALGIKNNVEHNDHGLISTQLSSNIWSDLTKLSLLVGISHYFPSQPQLIFPHFWPIETLWPPWLPQPQTLHGFSSLKPPSPVLPPLSRLLSPLASPPCPSGPATPSPPPSPPW